MKQLTTLLLFLLIASFCKGQSTVTSDTVLLANLNTEINLLGKTNYYYDSSGKLSAAQVSGKPFQRFITKNIRVKVKPEKISSMLYLKVLLKNNTNREVTSYLNPGLYFTEYNIYKIEESSVRAQGAGNTSNYKKIVLKAGETSYYLLQIKPLKTEFGSLYPVLIHANYLERYDLIIKRQKSNTQIFGLILSGVLLMMILFMLANFVTSGKREFLYNAAYSAFMFLLIFFNSVNVRLSTPFNNFFYSYLDFFLLVTGTVFYMSFARSFLNTKNNYTLLDRILKYGQQFILLLLGIFTFLNFFTDSFLPQYYLETIVKILFLLLGIAFIFLALKRRDRLFNYIAAGNAMLVIFSSVSFVLLSLNVRPSSIYLNPLFYYNSGIILELVFFILGLTYKNRRELIRELKIQGALKLEAEKKDFETQLAVIKAQQEERNRISADMHDDLGAGMTTISLYSALAKAKLANNPIPEIEKISTSANDLLNKMNAIIWSMSSSNDSLGNMIAYIRSYALEYFEDTGINCKIDIPERLPNIEVVGEIRRNVFLVVKEALNNILKHAKATEVGITLVRVEDGLTLYIQDNGTGINMDKIRQFGNGLKNMKKRAADIHIDLSIENKEGTLITMHRKIQDF